MLTMIEYVSLAWFFRSFNLESVSHRCGNTSSTLTITEEISLKTMVSYFKRPYLNFQFRRFFSQIAKKGLELDNRLSHVTSETALTELAALGLWPMYLRGIFCSICVEIFLPIVNSHLIIPSLLLFDVTDKRPNTGYFLLPLSTGRLVSFSHASAVFTFPFKDLRKSQTGIGLPIYDR